MSRRRRSITVMAKKAIPKETWRFAAMVCQEMGEHNFRSLLMDARTCYVNIPNRDERREAMAAITAVDSIYLEDSSVWTPKTQANLQ